MAANTRGGSASRFRRATAALLVLAGAVVFMGTAAPGGIASAQANVAGVTVDLQATDEAACPGTNGLKTEIGKTLRYCVVVTNTTDAEVPAVIGMTVEDLLVPAKAETFNAFGKASGGAIRPGDSVVIEVGVGRVNDVHASTASRVNAEVNGQVVTDTVSVQSTRPSLFVRDQLTKTANRTEVAAGGFVQFDFTLTNLHGQTINDVVLRDNICGVIEPVSGDTNGNGSLEVSEVWTYRCTGPVTDSGNVSVSAIGIDAGGIQIVSTNRLNMVVDGVVVDGNSPQRPAVAGSTPTTAAGAASPTTAASVLGATTVPIVSGGTLPLTGIDNGPLTGIALVLIASGLLMLGADRMLRPTIADIS